MRKILIGFIIMLFWITSGFSYRVLFDYTKNETAGNADWIVDRDFPYPSPQNPSSESSWDGAFSAFGYAIYTQMHDTIATLHNSPITYGDQSNALDLSNFDVFVIPEPQNPFTNAEKQAIITFVRNGGGLLLISDHNMSDRNSSGWDSPRVFNDLGTGNLFGIHFNITGESNNNFSVTTQEITEDSTTNGPFGIVSALAYHSGDGMTLEESNNNTVHGIIFKTTQHDNTAVMFAVARYGQGKVAALGDSSPVDDGTGDSHDHLYDGWDEEGNSHKALMLNTVNWLEQKNPAQNNITFHMDGLIDSTASYIAGNGSIALYSAVNDSFIYTGIKFSPHSGMRIYTLFSPHPYDTTSTPWCREGLVGKYNFYLYLNTSYPEVVMRDSLGLPLYSQNIQDSFSDSIFEIMIPRNIERGDTLYFLGTGFSSASGGKIIYSLPTSEEQGGMRYYNYIAIPLKTNSGASYPSISDITYSQFLRNQPVIVRCKITDTTNISNASVYYYFGTSGSYISTVSDSQVSSLYYFTIPASGSDTILHFHIHASDAVGNSSTSNEISLQLTDNLYRVYFEGDNIGEKMGEFIHNATYSLDISMYEIFQQTIVDSLISAHNRGIKVRIITDSTYITRQGTQDLINAGIPVINEGIGDNSPDHIMHNKFIVRDIRDGNPDNDYLWTGSFNASDERHIDNSIAIKSTDIAGAFEAEFNQMWGSTGDTPNAQNARTGTRKHDVLSSHQFVLQGDSISVYFSPQDSAIQYIIDLVEHARSSISYLIFSFTDNNLKDALLAAHQNGVLIKGVHDNNSRDADPVRLNTVFNDLKNSGISVYWASVPQGYTMLHDKFMVLDTMYVITGSMNWTGNGCNRNDENIVIIKNRAIALSYLHEFDEMYDYSRFHQPAEQLTTYNVKIGKSMVWPNPFYSVLYFNAASAVIYDAQGRRITKKLLSHLWDGRNKNKRQVHPGVYFIKLSDRKEPIPVVKLSNKD